MTEPSEPTPPRYAGEATSNNHGAETLAQPPAYTPPPAQHPTPPAYPAPPVGQPLYGTPSQHPYVQPPGHTVYAPVLVNTAPEKSTGIAYLLWFFFGIFGVHQFYMGKIGRGIGYLLTLGWLTVGLWIDLFTMAAQVRAVNTQRRVGLR